MAAILEKTATFLYNFINFQYFSKIQKVVKKHFNSNKKILLWIKFHYIKFLATAIFLVAKK